TFPRTAWSSSGHRLRSNRDYPNTAEHLAIARRSCSFSMTTKDDAANIDRNDAVSKNYALHSS
ncbi:MAG: hypothetical protein ACXWC3_27050, partial [Burkholderiales bacterium]